MNETQLWETAERVMTTAQFDVFRLRYRDNLKVNTIANSLQVTPQAVRERLRKGTDRLIREKQRLEEAA